MPEPLELFLKFFDLPFKAFPMAASFLLVLSEFRLNFLGRELSFVKLFLDGVTLLSHFEQLRAHLKLLAFESFGAVRLLLTKVNYGVL